MKFLKTSRLFYKKWPFKVECYLKGANRIKYNGIDAVMLWCLGHSIPRNGWWENDKNVDKAELLKFAKSVKDYLDKDLQIRCEGGHFNIFCKDRDLLDSIIRDLDKWIVAVHEPSDDMSYDFLVENTGNKVICDEYPWDGYQYKLTLRERMPADAKANFLKWVERYSGKIRVSNSSLLWLEDKKRWMQDPFVYVKDQGTLTMTLLYLGTNCKKTFQYILKSSINTPCPH